MRATLLLVFIFLVTYGGASLFAYSYTGNTEGMIIAIFITWCGIEGMEATLRIEE
jgi:hypothetical protein